ncbi:MAG: 4Fe-4S dicluster domain-containing protein [Planctomycetota bacterium]|jgi:NADH dehydrogenase/NADH:ubiquinone oxidoreductase subunit G
MALIKTIIDGKEIEVERDRWVLDVAREMGIHIPTLCHHPALEPYGACRLCVVEVTKGKWTWLTTSCDLPIREGLSIKTDTTAVIESRKMAIELLWARAPEAEYLKLLAKELGVEKTRFTSRNDIGKCILCGLCVRVCDKLIGASAISFANRGYDRRVTTPFKASSDSCIGCNACVAVCPTGHILTEDKDAVREMKTWRTEINLVLCEDCGKPYIPDRQFEFIQTRFGEQIPLEKVCLNCRRSQTVERLKVATVNNK